MFTLLLQTTDSLSVATNSNGISILELLMSGGFFMIPLLILSILAVYFFFERYFAIKTDAKSPENLMNNVNAYILSGNVNAALASCQDDETAVGRVLEKGLRRIGKPFKNIENSMENVARLELSKLENRLAALGTIAGVAPMVGFLGTVTGMIKAFYDLSSNSNGGAIDSGLLAGGIYEAMLTTAAGLLIGIVALVGYNFLVAKLNNVTYNIEWAASQLLDLLQEPAK